MESMSKHVTGDTKFTEQVKILLNKIYGRSPLKDSVLERAIAYYDLEQFSDRKLDKLEKDLANLKQVDSAKSQEKIVNLERDQREYLQELRFERNDRSQHLQQICRE